MLVTHCTHWNNGWYPWGSTAHCPTCCRCHHCHVVVAPAPVYVPYVPFTPPVIYDGYFEAQQKLAGKRSR